MASIDFHLRVIITLPPLGNATNIYGFISTFTTYLTTKPA